VLRLPKEILDDISCSSAKSCVAVGTYQRNGKTLALRWNGSRWMRTATPNPNANYGEALTAVSCVSAKDCWAFGY
jgi:hypothetical protein